MGVGVQVLKAICGDEIEVSLFSIDDGLFMALPLLRYHRYMVRPLRGRTPDVTSVTRLARAAC